MTIDLGKKLFFYTGCTLVAVLLTTFLVLERHQAGQWEEYLRSQSVSFARFATPELLKFFRGEFPPSNGQDLRDVYDFLGFNRQLIRFSLYSPGGRELFVSPHFPDFIDLEPLVESGGDLPGRLSGGQVSLEVLSLPAGGRALDVVAPAFGPTGKQVLAARYLVSFDLVDARVREMRTTFFRIALGTVVGSLILAALVARRFTRPLKELTEGARAIARGDLATQISVHSRDEIGTLACAFNDMAVSLSGSRSELQTKNAALTRANADLQEIQDQLIRTERLAAVGQLAAGVSHEIDNPVGIILGYAELLLEDLDEEDPRREDVAAIIDECKRCKRITGGLLGLARTTSARCQPIDLNALVRGTLDSLRPQKLFKGVDVRFTPAPQLPPVSGDADRLRQVLVNLALNAAQAMNAQGRLEVSLRRQGPVVQIMVADSGPGIGEGLRERIFEPFFSTKPRGEGTGLGLSVCRRLIEENGGQLTAAAASGGGAEFCIELPLEHDGKIL